MDALWHAAWKSSSHPGDEEARERERERVRVRRKTRMLEIRRSDACMGLTGQLFDLKMLLIEFLADPRWALDLNLIF